MKTEWLKKCESLADPMPENEIGGLLQDYAKLAVLYAECMKRNHALIDYLQPIVSKERGATQ